MAYVTAWGSAWSRLEVTARPPCWRTPIRICATRISLRTTAGSRCWRGSMAAPAGFTWRHFALVLYPSTNGSPSPMAARGSPHRAGPRMESWFITYPRETAIIASGRSGWTRPTSLPAQHSGFTISIQREGRPPFCLSGIPTSLWGETNSCSASAS